MPTYQYRCTACQHEFDCFQRFSEDPLTECPVCAALIKRVVQPVGVVFKGSGWYITDSRKSDSSSKADSSNKSESATKTETASKSESGSPNGSSPAKKSDDATSKPSEKKSPSTADV